MMVWLLRNRFLYQVHSYVTLLPPAAMSTSQTTDSRVRSSEMSVSEDSSTDASGSLGTCVLAVGSDPANIHSLSLSDADSSAVNNDSVSDGRRINPDAKENAFASELL